MKPKATAPSTLFKFYDCVATRVDSELDAVLRKELEYTIGADYFYEFNATVEDFYSVLSVIDAHNAPVLMELGMMTPESVVRFLRRNDLNYLVRDNTALTETATRLGVPLYDYIDLYASVRVCWDKRDSMIRALEEYAKMEGKKHCRKQLLPLMASGMVSYEDAQEIGYAAIEEERTNRNLMTALSILKDRKEKKRYTASDIKKALAHISPVARSARLGLMISYGAEEAFKIRNTRYVNTLVSRAKAALNTIPFDLLLFVDAVLSEVNTNPSVDDAEKLLPSLSVMKRFHNEGVDPSIVAAEFAKGEWNENRILALHQGIANAVTPGWL